MQLYFPFLSYQTHPTSLSFPRSCCCAPDTVLSFTPSDEEVLPCSCLVKPHCCQRERWVPSRSGKQGTSLFPSVSPNTPGKPQPSTFAGEEAAPKRRLCLTSGNCCWEPGGTSRVTSLQQHSNRSPQAAALGDSLQLLQTAVEVYGTG